MSGRRTLSLTDEKLSSFELGFHSRQINTVNMGRKVKHLSSIKQHWFDFLLWVSLNANRALINTQWSDSQTCWIKSVTFAYCLRLKWGAIWKQNLSNDARIAKSSKWMDESWFMLIFRFKMCPFRFELDI